jgi:hypothetical protein
MGLDKSTGTTSCHERDRILLEIARMMTKKGVSPQSVASHMLPSATIETDREYVRTYERTYVSTHTDYYCTIL